MKILEQNDMGFLLKPLKDYSVAWYNALARELDMILANNSMKADG